MPRRVLLAGTALVSTLMVAAPTLASAQTLIISNFPVNFTNKRDCILPGTCVAIVTFGTGASINFTNTGDLAVLGVTASAIL